MFCHDAANTGYSNCNISEKNKLLWSVKTDIMSSSCPAVLDGKIYVTTGAWGEGQIHCIDLETGSFIWNYSVGDSIWGSPVVDENHLYVAPRKSRILCLNSSTGTKIWETIIENASIYEESPALYEGKIYIGCTYIPSVEEYNSGVYCLDSLNGEILWFNATISESYDYSPAVSNGKIYTVGINNSLCCLDAKNGHKIWKLTNFSFYSYPVIINDCIYVRTFQGTVLCIEDGEVLWEYHPIPNYVVTTSIVGKDGNIFLGTGNSELSNPGRVVCVDEETGEEKWSYMTTGVRKYSGRLSLTKDYLFIMEEYCYDTSHQSSSICSFDVKTGERVWYYTISMDFDNYVYGGIAIADDKIIFSSVESDDDSGDVWGGVYCFNESDSNLPPCSPSTDYDRFNHLLSIISIDPEGDKIRYGISWDNDKTVDEWTVFCESGTYIYVVCNNRRGTFGVVAEDEYGAQSDWVSQKSKSNYMHIFMMKNFLIFWATLWQKMIR